MRSAGDALTGLVLDIGCADRRLRHYLRRNACYLGLDYPSTAASIYHTTPDVFGDATKLPFADGCITSVALLDVLEHLPDPMSGIAEIARVLEPGGTVVIQVPFVYPLHDAPFDFYRFTRFGLRRMLDDCGLVVVREEFQGHPIETASLIANIALSRTIIRFMGARNILAIPLGMAALLLIPLHNLVGWIFASFGGVDDLVPFGYRFYCRRLQ